MMFVSFNSNTMGATNGAKHVKSSGAPEFTPGFVGFVLLNLYFSVDFCR